MPDRPQPLHFLRGRGSVIQTDSRFAQWRRQALDDGWPATDDACPPRTRVSPDAARTVITRNRSPDVPFDRSINPYRGCEHGCAYCFARPSHAWLGLSPGLDFETRLSAKFDAPARLTAELARPSYRCAPIALGVNTDAYQPVERQLGLTRGILQVLAAHRHPVMIVTKGALIERDVDILAPMAEARLVQVMVSLTTLDASLARTLEPRAAAPKRRLEVVRTLSAAGVPVGVLMAPLIPALTDHEMEPLLAAAAEAGAGSAGYVVLRLPNEVAPLFRDWLARHAPDRARHVMSLVAQLRGGRDNDPRFGQRMRGQGPIAALYRQRFALICRRLGLNRRHVDLDSNRFRVPPAPGEQLSLL
ncbi:PA0069 family radical SAM protein [Nitrogeniibacter mangrovi]|uniref:PA0069 family radical SAM protein n=1 Tax=Nitrogeniibacter mangrovi TaxID=2016596 RepID=A0A6C1B5F0_9RHOO|nr:PA0069 family radical SAM protein [Nitrogeniibacter mangrovi]QID18697.1 PA0069 family radical SAM protein [Nitrogeniibacter mangrovi]